MATSKPVPSPGSSPSGSPLGGAPPPLVGTLVDRRVSVHDAVRVGRWSVDGTSKVLGDAECVEATVRGTVSVRGKFMAARLRVEGILEVDSGAEFAQSLEVNGSGRFGSSLKAGSARLDGTVEVSGPVLVGGSLVVSGKLGTAGSIQAKSLGFRGRVDSSGDWTVDSVDGRLEGESRLRQLRAVTVQFRRDGSRRKGRVTVDRIDAKEVYLEAVEVEYLKADRIELGADCHVAQADGTIVRRHRSAVVGFEVRSQPPPWLTR